MRTYILLAVVACALASPIDDKSTVLSASSSSNRNPDISTLPLKKDSNSTSDSVNAHPLHKRDSSDPPKVADKTSQNSSPAPTKEPVKNLSVNRPLTQDPILSQNSRVKRDSPRVAVADQKSAVTPKPDDKQKQDHSTQQLPKTQTTQETRKTRDAPKPADAKATPTLNKKPEDPLTTGQKSNKPVAASQFARTRRDAPNPHEQSKIVPSAIQPDNINDNQKLSQTVTASPPLIAKSPQHKRESVQLSSNTQSPTFVHPVPVDQILNKSPTNAS